MQSTTEHFKRIPKDWRKNLEFRVKLLRLCDDNPDYQAAAMHLCREDFFFFLNAFIWQVNPLKPGHEFGPFIAWKCQVKWMKETMRTVLGDKREDMLWEKSREMGATWLALILAVWLCLFHKNKRVLLISHSEQAVYKAGDDGTLFAKLEFILDHLPGWMTAGIVRRKLSFKFPGRSGISGTATTERSGVGDRASLVVLDEFSKHEEGAQIWGSTADVGPRLVIGTHYGVAGCYYELSQKAGKTSVLRKIVMHWTEHEEKKKGLYKVSAKGEFQPFDLQYDYGPDFRPVLDGSPTGGPFPGVRSPWYDAECLRRDNDRDVAMHLDINPQGAVAQFYNAMVIRRLKGDCRAPDWRGDLVYGLESADPSELRPDTSGPLKLWIRPGMVSGKLLRVPAGRYTLGADISTGMGATPSCLSIFNTDLGLKVGQYTDRWKDPKQFAYLAVAICRMFTDPDGDPAWIAWETPGAGLMFGHEVLKVIGFRNIYWKSEQFSKFEEVSDKPGWVAQPKSKLKLHDDYKDALGKGYFVNLDEDALDECLSYVHTDGSVEFPKKGIDDPAGEGQNHGDHVVADALAYLMATRRGMGLERIPPPKPEPVTGFWARRREREKAKADELVWQ